MSSISRAFTTRRVKQSVDIANHKRDGSSTIKKDMPQRSKTVRAQISAPLELIHTTNMLSYNAPDIARSNSVSTNDESDSPATVGSSPPTSPDVDTKDDSKNHLSRFFMAPPDASAFKTAELEVASVPAIPKRSPSHTKKASFENFSKQRSPSLMSRESDRTVSSKASFNFSRTSSTSTAASSTSHSSLAASPKAPPVPSVPAIAFQSPRHTEDHHPFGRELAQVSEMAEEFSIKRSAMEEEEFAIKQMGLHKHSADDYLNEVQGLFVSFFGNNSRTAYPQPREQPQATMWI